MIFVYTASGVNLFTSSESSSLQTCFCTRMCNHPRIVQIEAYFERNFWCCLIASCLVDSFVMFRITAVFLIWLPSSFSSESYESTRTKVLLYSRTDTWDPRYLLGRDRTWPENRDFFALFRFCVFRYEIIPRKWYGIMYVL